MAARIAIVNFFSEAFIYMLTFKKRIASGENPSFDETKLQIEELLEAARKKNFSEPDEFHKISQYYEDDKYDSALFAVVAFIDEAIISSVWLYKKEWSKNLLQKKLFKTMTAGAEFFKRLEEVKEVATEDERNIIEVYYYCLVFGFEGIYYNDLSKVKQMTELVYTKISRYDQVFNKHLLPNKPKRADKIIREFRINTSTFITFYMVGVGVFFILSFWTFASSLSTTMNFLMKVFTI